MMEAEKRPLLTVVVPVYNGRDYIEHTIDSILRSEYSHIELLLIDDGSTDGSSEVCAACRGKDDRVRYERTDNHGIVAARNRGLELARGEYICFCDQDDEVEPFAYAEMMEKLLDEDAEIGLCSTGRNIDGRKSIYESLEDGCYRQAAVLEYVLYPILFRGYGYDFVKTNNYLYGTLWKCIFRKSFLQEHHMSFRCFVNYEDDWLFVTEALTYAETVVAVSNVGYYWRVNASSKSHQKQYICNLPRRFADMDAYVMGYLRSRIQDEDILEAYHRINMCEHYVDAYRNALGADGKEEKRAAKREIEEYLRSSRYREQLSCVRQLKGTAFRRKAIYYSLLHMGIGFTFFVNKLVSLIERGSGRVQWLVLWERKMKMKKQ